MMSALRALGARIERMLAGQLPAALRKNMMIELWVAITYGIFYAMTLPFIPVLLRRSGATAEMVALYTAQQFIGSVLTAFSIVLMRRRRTMNIIVVCWLISRSLILFFAFIVNPVWMLILGAGFWLLEAFPNPGYTRILQKIYPDGVRQSDVHRAHGADRRGRADYAAGRLGARPLGLSRALPIGSIIGVIAVLIFTRLEVNERPLPVRQTKTLNELWTILQTDKRFAYYLTTFGLYGAGSLMSWTIYPLIQVDRLHLSYSALGWLGLVQSSFWFFSYLFWGRLVDRYGGVWVLRLNCAFAMLMPLVYVFATTAWMLIPAFAVAGIISAGWDIGMIIAGMQLAPEDKVTEYAAVQGTIIGLRGMIMPLVSVTLLRFGLPYSDVFAISILLMAVAWIMFGRIDAPMPDRSLSELRYRWPIRFRLPKM
ncbi:MAG: MFS transporter [Caldilineaceae bacterium]